jgi:hypothetical protein
MSAIPPPPPPPASPISVALSAVTPPPLTPFIPSAGGLEATLSLGQPFEYQTPKFNAEEAKATAAKEVARVLVFTFAATIAMFFLTIALIYGLSASPSQARDFVTAFVAILSPIENFVTKVFGPLLAFVLGYYFSENSKTTTG